LTEEAQMTVNILRKLENLYAFTPTSHPLRR